MTSSPFSQSARLPAAKSAAGSLSSTKSIEQLKSRALPLAEHVCFALYSSSLAMTKVYRPLLKEIGLSYPQYLLMVALWERDDQSVSELGDTLFLDSGTLTPMLKRLQTLGHLSRERSREDERQVRITLTAKGRALQTKAQPIPGCILDATGCQLQSLIELNAQLKALRSNLLGVVS